MRIWDRIVGHAGSTRLAERRARDRLAARAWRRRPADDGARSRARLRQIGFTIGVIALGAKMAGADGDVSDVEIEAFRNFFQVPPGEEKNVERFFDLAKRDVGGLRALRPPARGAVPRRAGSPGERARRPVRHRPGRRPGRRRGGRLSRQGGAHLRPQQRALRARAGRRRWASSSASRASSSASTRWRPTSRCARRGCARCAPIIPTG